MLASRAKAIDTAITNSEMGPDRVMKEDVTKCATLGELTRAGYQTAPVRLEMRNNLVKLLRRNERILPGIIGYDETVVPEIENAVLAGHHMILLGERGQAKSRLIRSLALLLDEHTAAIKGCEINDDPYAPICRRCVELAAQQGDALPIAWIPRD